MGIHLKDREVTQEAKLLALLVVILERCPGARNSLNRGKSRKGERSELFAILRDLVRFRTIT